MADTFADLWNTAAPSSSNSNTKPQTLASASNARNTNTTVSRNRPDLFNMLAGKPPSTQSNSRPITPYLSTSNASTSQPHQPGHRARLTPSPSPSPATTSNSSDAFSSLLSTTSEFGNAYGRTDVNKLSIAERQKQVERERKGRLERDLNAAAIAGSKGGSGEASVWNGLDLIGSSGSTPTLLSGRPSPSPALRTTKSDSNDWLSDFASESNSGKTPPAENDSGTKLSHPRPKVSASKNLFDTLDDFLDAPTPVAATSSSPNRNGNRSPQPPPPVASTNGSSIHVTPPEDEFDFDFGNREYKELDEDDGDEDLLGDLGKPVEEVRKTRPPPAARRQSDQDSPPSRASRPRPSPKRSNSPPPHVIGQIVEMGFTPEQARVALAATETGVDVQQALEMLLNAGDTAPSETTEDERDRIGPGRRSRRYDDDDEEPAPRRRGPRTQQPPSQAQQQQQQSGDLTVDIQEKADKLIAQASEIGLGVFNRANALWRGGKEKMQKVYEERVATSGPGSSGGGGESSRGNVVSGDGIGRGGMRVSGRPKWMVDSAADLDEELGGGNLDKGPILHNGFRDRDDDVGPVEERGEFGGGGVRDRVRKMEKQQERKPPALAPKPSGVNARRLLFEDDDQVYVSPARRRAKEASAALDTFPVPAARTRRLSPPPAPAPPVLVKRTTVSASTNAISNCTQRKNLGTEKFKLGQYAEACSHYSTAISSLPSKHLLLVPLWTNRALTRIKTGEYALAEEDCSSAIQLIGEGYRPGSEEKVEREEEGSGVDLAEGLKKAVRRRAEAREGKEKWEEAKSDWEKLIGFSWASAKEREEAIVGARRCRNILEKKPSDEGGEPPKPRPVPRARPPPPSLSSKPQRAPARAKQSEAVATLRMANKAADEEDSAKHDLKDSVDAHLAAWKGGKESNIRALLASMESVLWSNSGWKGVNMAELVTEKQVKVVYTRAIAKVHPDKLNTSATTLEQRMIANGVFGALNDAWNAFKQ